MSSFAFALPWLLGLLPLAGALLVYAYRRRGEARRVRVATVLILRELRRSAASPRSFEPPPRFWVELLLVLLMLLGAAGLYREGSGERVVVILDDSLSLAAVDPLVPAGRSNFDEARASAQSFVLALPAEDQVEVALASGATGTVGTVSPAQALEVIERSRPAFATDNLDRVIARFAADPGWDRIVVFTDRGLSGAAPERVSFVTARLSERGAPPNVAIAAVRAGGGGVAVTVSAYTVEPVEVRVVFEEVQPEGSVVPVGSELVQLEAGGSATVNFPMAPGVEAFRISLGEARGFARQNSIRLDDTAWVVPVAGTRGVLLVSDLTPGALGLNRLRHLSFEHLPPERWTPAAAEDAPAVIFHRFQPAELPGMNAMFVLPSGQGAVAAGVAVPEAEVTRWDNGHPILSYLNVPMLSLRAVTPLRLPEWGREMIVTSAGLAAFAGELRGSRYVALGFELFPYEGKRSPLLSVLTLNALQWLSRGGSGFHEVGTAIPVGRGTREVRVRSSGESLVIPSGAAEVRVGEPGLADIIGSAGERSVVAVNFLSEAESNLAAQGPVTISAAGGGGEMESSSDSKRFLSGLLALGALLLLLLDGLVRLRPTLAAGYERTGEER